MLNKMKIRTRLLSGFGFALLITIIIGILSISVTWNVAGNYNEYIKNGEAALSSAKECRVYVLWIATDVRNLVISEDASTRDELITKIEGHEQSFKDQFLTLQTSYAATVSAIDDITGTKSEAITKYGEAVAVWIEKAQEIIDATKANNYELAGDMVLNECTPILNGVVDIANDIQKDLDNVVAKQIAQIRNYANYASFFLFGVMLITCVLIVWLSLRIAASIIRPIKQVQDAAEEMAKGNLHFDLKYRSKDGVGMLAESLRVSQKVLIGYVDDIDRAMGSMADGNFDLEPTEPFVGDFKNIENSITKFIVRICKTLNGIKAAITMMDAATQNVSEGASILSSGAQTQANSVEELSVAIDEVSRKVTHGAERSRDAQQTVLNVGNELQASTEQMQEMVSAMSDINNSSSEIGKIIKTIEDIAFQTNILALNAAVEAARAGAAGKGFAVVADEVRNLASKSAEAAKGTTKMIGDSQSAIVTGGKIVEKTSTSLYKVENGAKSVTEIIGEITDAARLQAEAIEQVTHEITQISDIVQTNAATAEESAAASTQIASQARELQNMVDHFILKDDETIAMMEKAIQ